MAGDPGSVRQRVETRGRELLRPVINATGILLHTNLGRAPVAHEQRAEAWNLEMDLETGERTSRQRRLGQLLSLLTGAEAALAVNNGAAAVLLGLTVLAAKRPVLVSRGELVEIGGGFRLPEVVAASGARLVEVGTTNRTRLSDYTAALRAWPETAAILKVHPSNYRMLGFTESAPVGPLARLGPPVVVDVGSGLLDERTPWLPGPTPAWLAGEPGVRQTLEAGASVVTFSGDKLLGGPQAGMLVGAADLVSRCGAHPLYRALRPGALVLGALQETLLAYLRRDATAVPFWRRALLDVPALRRRAEVIVSGLERPGGIAVVECQSTAGGGSVPGSAIASAGLALPGDRRAELRVAEPPVLARVSDGRTVLDLRTVDPAEDAALAKVLSGLGKG